MTKIIRTIPSKSSCGYDNVSNILLKKLSPSIVKSLTLICNRALYLGYFPIDMKKAIISPLYKAKEKYLITNYRPISLLIVFSKCLEKAIHS